MNGFHSFGLEFLFCFAVRLISVPIQSSYSILGEIESSLFVFRFDNICVSIIPFSLGLFSIRRVKGIVGCLASINF